MRRIKRNTRQKGKGSFFSLILLMGFLVIFFFGYSLLFRPWWNEMEKDYKNLEISFSKGRSDSLIPSGKLLVDGDLVYQTDSLSWSIDPDTVINLKPGKHQVQISTIEGDYELVDSIEIVEYPMTYYLNIHFNCELTFEEKRIQIENLMFEKSIEEKDYSEEEKLEIRRWAKQNSGEWLRTELSYHPREPHFDFNFIAANEIIIE